MMMMNIFISQNSSQPNVLQRRVATYLGKRGCVMVSALDSGSRTGRGSSSGSSSGSSPVSGPGRVIVLCFRAGHLTLTVPLSTQE